MCLFFGISLVAQFYLAALVLVAYPIMKFMSLFLPDDVSTAAFRN